MTAATAGEVALWQSLLAAGFDVTVQVTGEWDDRTLTATAEWQRAAQVRESGALNDATWTAAGEAIAFVATKVATNRPDLTPGDRGDHVRYAQRRLVARGYPTPIDGVYGPRMGRAVGQFRQAQGLPSELGVDEVTWQALG